MALGLSFDSKNSVQEKFGSTVICEHFMPISWLINDFSSRDGAEN